MTRRSKQDHPLDDIRRHLEPGPVVLVSSAWQGRTNIMTMGWHMMLAFTPALIATYIWEGNHSFGMIRKSRECVVNVPTRELVDAVVGIGNCSGAEVDKFARFGLTADPAAQVAAPLIRECYASFECRLAARRGVAHPDVFVWEVVKAHVAPSPRNPRTLHYRGHGEFMVAGPTISRRAKFRPEML